MNNVEKKMNMKRLLNLDLLNVADLSRSARSARSAGWPAGCVETASSSSVEVKVKVNP